jgi:hypothetical protein
VGSFKQGDAVDGIRQHWTELFLRLCWDIFVGITNKYEFAEAIYLLIPVYL